MEKYSIKFTNNWVGSDWSLANVVYYDLDDNITINTSEAVKYSFNDNLSAVGDMAFLGSSLNYIVLPLSISTIGSGAFSFCSDLEYITVPSSVISVGALCFSDSPKINAIYAEDVPRLVNILKVSNSDVTSLVINLPQTYEGYLLSNNVLPITHTDFVYTNNKGDDGLNTNLTTELDSKANKDSVRTVNVISWENENVRFYAERGTVASQGFTESYGIPTTRVLVNKDGVEQYAICLPDPNSAAQTSATVAGLTREFPQSDFEDVRKYGGVLSATSMLGSENMVDGLAGCASIALIEVINSSVVGRIGFKFESIYKNNKSYLLMTSLGGLSEPIYLNELPVATVPLDGSVEGLPEILVGEWFDWGIQIPPNFTRDTFCVLSINGKETPITLKYGGNPYAAKNVCTANLSSWNNTNKVGGSYSYHTNYGLTIMKESGTKIISDDILSKSDQLLIITPEGDLPITLQIEENISPLKIGTMLSIVANNSPSTIDIIGNTSFLINGLRNTHIEVWRKMIVEGINISSGGVNYYMDIPNPSYRVNSNK